jgi:hypothetical protein
MLLVLLAFLAPFYITGNIIPTSPWAGKHFAQRDMEEI